jgi:hypothetical protein
MPIAPVPGPALCDSCLKPATPEHIRDRMARLQLATRYRPIHIGPLLVCAAVPANPADDFYASGESDQSDGARDFAQSLFACCGVPAGKPGVDQLADFQRRGVYLSRLIECPLVPGEPVNCLAEKYGQTFVKRVNLSYKPKAIALLDPVPEGLAELLVSAGLGEKLIDAGKGIVMPSPTDAAGIAAVQALLSKAFPPPEPV